MKALFICIGNTCRSPMCMFALRRYLSEQNVRGIEVDSAGLVDHQKKMSENSYAVLKKYGFNDIDYVSKPATQKLLDEADVIFTVTDDVKAALKDFTPEDKLFSLSMFVAGGIEDPYGKSLADYERAYLTFYHILPSLTKFLKEQKKRKKSR